MTQRISPDLQDKNRRAALLIVLVVVGMIGLSFASVPLYNLFCRVTGWGGTTQVAAALPDASQIVDRDITVRFDANVARDLPWDFRPEEVSQTLKIGARGVTNFIAENRSHRAVGGTALFNVTPLKAGKYFQKIQCFCFGEQVLQPNQRVDMPVMFYVDPALHEDPDMDDVTTITLSYSFFRIDSKALDQAYDAFYEGEVLPE